MKKYFEDIIKQHEATTFSVCYMYGETKPEVEDLFQEVLIHIWRGLPNFKGESNPSTWIYRISLNVCISYKRKKKIDCVPLNVGSDVFDETSRSGKQNKLLHDRIVKLDKLDRALVLLWLEDMSYEEIGAIIGINPKSVGVKLVRIKEKLKNM